MAYLYLIIPKVCFSGLTVMDCMDILYKDIHSNIININVKKEIAVSPKKVLENVVEECNVVLLLQIFLWN